MQFYIECFLIFEINDCFASNCSNSSIDVCTILLIVFFCAEPQSSAIGFRQACFHSHAAIIRQTPLRIQCGARKRCTEAAQCEVHTLLAQRMLAVRLILVPSIERTNAHEGEEKHQECRCFLKSPRNQSGLVGRAGLQHARNTKKTNEEIVNFERRFTRQT